MVLDAIAPTEKWIQGAALLGRQRLRVSHSSRSVLTLDGSPPTRTLDCPAAWAGLNLGIRRSAQRSVEPLVSLIHTRRAMVQDHQSRTADARMTLILEPIIWSNGYSPPDDYYLIKEGQRIGRISRMNAAMELWCWIPTGPRPSDAKPGGVVHSLDEAEAAVEAAWERRVRGQHGIISMRWANRFVMALLAIAAIFAAIVIPNLFFSLAERRSLFSHYG